LAISSVCFGPNLLHAAIVVYLQIDIITGKFREAFDELKRREASNLE